jgi:hypothetical protein
MSAAARSLSIGKVTRMSDHGAMPKLTLQRLPLDHFGSFVAAIDGVNTPHLQMAEEEPPCFTRGAHDAFCSQKATAGQDFSQQTQLDTTRFNTASWRGVKGDGAAAEPLFRLGLAAGARSAHGRRARRHSLRRRHARGALNPIDATYIAMLAVVRDRRRRRQSRDRETSRGHGLSRACRNRTYCSASRRSCRTSPLAGCAGRRANYLR